MRGRADILGVRGRADILGGREGVGCRGEDTGKRVES